MKIKNQNIPFWFLPQAILGVITIAVLFIYWGRCGSLLIDTFRDPIVAWKITTGQVLYHDVFYEYGVLPPYVLALFIKFFGFQLNTFLAVGASTFIATVILMYGIARKFLSCWLAILPAIVFATVFGVKQYYPEDVFTYLFPYSFASVFFSVAGTGALLMFFSAVEDFDSRGWYFWAIWMYIAFLCRAEASFLVWIGFFSLAEGKKRKILFLPPLVAVLTYGVFLFVTKSFDSFYLSNIKHIVVAVTDKIYFTNLGGGITFGDDIIKALQAFCLQMFCVVVLALASRLCTEDTKGKAWWFVCAALAGWLAAKHISAIDFYRSLPLVLVLGIILAFLRCKAGKGDKTAKKEIVLYLMGLLFAARILFSTTPLGLSFCCLPVGIIGFYFFFFHALPGVLEKGFIRVRPKPFLALMAVLFISLHFSALKLSGSWLGSRNMLVKSSQGSIYCFPSPGTAHFWQTVAYLKHNTIPSSAVVVMPEGLGINFFAQRNNLFKYHTVLSPTLMMIGEDGVAGALAKSHPEYIVITPRDAGEYGKARFGIDYAQKIDEWIRKNYVLEKVFGPYPFTTTEPGFAIWHRKKI